VLLQTTKVLQHFLGCDSTRPRKMLISLDVLEIVKGVLVSFGAKPQVSYCSHQEKNVYFLVIPLNHQYNRLIVGLLVRHCIL
jgi:hypothetical protein